MTTRKSLGHRITPTRTASRQPIYIYGITTESRRQAPPQPLIHGQCSGRAPLPHPFSLWSRLDQRLARSQPQDHSALIWVGATGEPREEGVQLAQNPSFMIDWRQDRHLGRHARFLSLHAHRGALKSEHGGGVGDGSPAKSRKVHSRGRPQTWNGGF